MEEIEKKTSRKMYICKDCRERVLMSKPPKFCPNCGSSNITRDREKAEAFVKESLKALEDLTVEMDEKWEAYAETHAKYEAIVRSLSTSICRGILNRADIPKPHKYSLASYLQKYRESKNQEK